MLKKSLFTIVVLFTLFSCKKNNIEKNLDNEWQVSVLSLDGVNQVNSSNIYTLTFHSVSNGAGEITLHHLDNSSVSSYYYIGDFTLNDDYTYIDATMNSGGVNVVISGDLNVTSTELSINGTWTDNLGSGSQSLQITGSK